MELTNRDKKYDLKLIYCRLKHDRNREAESTTHLNMTDSIVLKQLQGESGTPTRKEAREEKQILIQGIPERKVKQVPLKNPFQISSGKNTKKNPYPFVK